MKRPSKIIICGEGGQGVQAVATILAKAAFNSGKEATFLPNFGVEQRGGVSLAFVQICGCEEDDKVCDCHIGFPKFIEAEVVICLRERAVDRVKIHLTKETLFVYDSNLVSGKSVQGLKSEKIAIPAENYARTKLEPRVFNIIILGAVIALTKVLKKEEVLKAMNEYFKDKYKKKPELKHLNQKALEVGIEMIEKIKKNSLTLKS